MSHRTAGPERAFHQLVLVTRGAALAVMAAGAWLFLAASASDALASHAGAAQAHTCPSACAVSLLSQHECRKAIRPTGNAIVAGGSGSQGCTPQGGICLTLARLPLVIGRAVHQALHVLPTGVALVGTVRLLN